MEEQKQVTLGQVIDQQAALISKWFARLGIDIEGAEDLLNEKINRIKELEAQLAEKNQPIDDDIK